MSEEKTERRKDLPRGIRIRTISIWIVASTILVSVLILFGIRSVMSHYHELINMTNEYIHSQNDIMDMSLGSRYLTEQSRLYVITGDSTYADAYFTEAEVTRRRDNALQEMSAYLEGTDDASLNLLADALRLSNELMDVEIHAMKLAAVSVNADLTTLPSKIQDYPLSEEESQSDPQQKADAAYRLVFGPAYIEMQQKIGNQLQSVSDSVILVCSQRQENSHASMNRVLNQQLFYTLLVVALVVLAYVMIAVLILKPIRLYINSIENNDALQITGAYEFRYLAITYNNIYEMAAAQQSILRRKAENDALTGLLNRASFEQMKTRLRDLSQPFALLLIDVDVFKSINDTYGHEMGDKALIRVANLLKENFRSTDHVFRIGGDEFAVVVTPIQLENQNIISEKIDNINHALQNPAGDFPKYSLSVGIAFSSDGYTDELFRQADKALYHTKENGRCGYTFFTP